MAATSITIKLDFGAETAADSSSVSRDGGVPTPFSSGALSSLAYGLSAEALPTPFASAALSLGQAESAPPPPSLSHAPAGSVGSASNVALHGDAPTPLDAGGFSAAPAGASAHALPTPMDNPAHSVGFGGGQAPDPHAAPSSDELAAPARDDDVAGEQR